MNEMISVFKLVEVSLNARAFDQGARGSRCNLQKWPKMKRGVCLENGQAGVQETVVLVMDKNLSLMARTHIQKKKKMSGVGAHLQYQDWGNKGKQIPGARWPQASLSRGTKSLTSKRLFSKMAQGKALTEFDS